MSTTAANHKQSRRSAGHYRFYIAEIFRKSARLAELRRELDARQAMNRMGKPAEVANAFLFLACDESSFYTASMLTVDGGMTAE
jgi:meso-butanediol dehydrogenase/(S,S)-butanediol dehydrogenase/diacetyl reductase